MRKFWENKGKDRKEDETIIKIQQENNKLQAELIKIQQELDCEQAIVREKQQFGRVRTTKMRYLRTKYGQELADRVQWRVNKRTLKQVSSNISSKVNI